MIREGYESTIEELVDKLKIKSGTIPSDIVTEYIGKSPAGFEVYYFVEYDVTVKVKDDRFIIYYERTSRNNITYDGSDYQKTPSFFESNFDSKYHNVL